MVREHDVFLEALAKGKAITTAFLRVHSADETVFGDLLDSSGQARGAAEDDAKGSRPDRRSHPTAKLLPLLSEVGGIAFGERKGLRHGSPVARIPPDRVTVVAFVAEHDGGIAGARLHQRFERPAFCPTPKNS
jgi:hypothetical protein